MDIGIARLMTKQKQLRFICELASPLIVLLHIHTRAVCCVQHRAENKKPAPFILHAAVDLAY
jgi:hypothetical protein